MSSLTLNLAHWITDTPHGPIDDNSLPPLPAACHLLRISPDGMYAASASADNRIVLLHLKESPKPSYHPHAVAHFQSNRGPSAAVCRLLDLGFAQVKGDQSLKRIPVLVSVMSTGDIVVWDVTDGRCLDQKRLLSQGQPAALEFVKSSEKDLLLLATRAGDLFVVRLDGLEVIKVFYGLHRSWVRQLKLWFPADATKEDDPHVHDPSLHPLLIVLTSEGECLVWNWPLDLKNYTESTLQLQVRMQLGSLFDQSTDVMYMQKPLGFFLNSFSNSLQVAVYGQHKVHAFLIPTHLEFQDGKTLEVAASDVAAYQLSIIQTEMTAIAGGLFLQNRVLLLWTPTGQWFLWHLDGTLVRKSPEETNYLIAGGSCCFSRANGGLFVSSLLQDDQKSLLWNVCRPSDQLEKVSTSCYPIRQRSPHMWTACTSIDDHLMAYGLGNGDIVVTPIHSFFYSMFDVTLPKRHLSGHKGAVTCLFVPYFGQIESRQSLIRKQWILSGGVDGTVRLWDLDTLKPLRIFRTSTQPISHLFVPPYDYYYNHVDNVVKKSQANEKTPELDLTTAERPPLMGQKVGTLLKKSKHKSAASLNSQSSSVSLMVVSPLVRLLKSSVYVLDRCNGLSIISLDDGTVRYQLGNYSEPLAWIQWHMDDSTVCLCYNDGLQLRWKLSSGSGILEDCFSAESIQPPVSDTQNPVLRIDDIVDPIKYMNMIGGAIALSLQPYFGSALMTIDIKKLLNLCEAEQEYYSSGSHESLHGDTWSSWSSEGHHDTLLLDLMKELICFLASFESEQLQKRLKEQLKLHSTTENNHFRHVAFGTNGHYQIQSVSYLNLHQRSHNTLTIGLTALVSLIKGYGSITKSKLICFSIRDRRVVPDVAKVVRFLHKEIWVSLPSDRIPNISLLSKFYYTSSSAKIANHLQYASSSLISGCLLHSDPEYIYQMCRYWYHYLPSVNGNPKKNKKIVRAVTTLSCIVTEELNSSSFAENKIQFEITESGPIGKGKPIQAGPRFVLDNRIKMELARSLVMLVMTQTDDTGPSSLNSPKLVAIQILGASWSVLETYLAHVKMGEIRQLTETSRQNVSAGKQVLLATNEDQFNPLFQMPANVFVFRRLMMHACQSSKTGFTQKGKSDETPLKKHRRRFSLSGIRRTRAASVILSPPFPSEQTEFTTEKPVQHDYQTTLISAPATANEVEQDSTPVKVRQQDILPLDGAALATVLFAMPNDVTIPLASRIALLEIADANPLFYVNMSSNDLLNIGSKEGEWERVRIVMKAGLSHMFKNRPMIYFPSHLPQVVESLIKGCLDPNIPFQIREKLMPSVTTIIHELIKCFPTVSFHASTQRLVVASGFHTTSGIPVDKESTSPTLRSLHLFGGTKVDPSLTGQVVVWDIRTATRIQVLDAHPRYDICALAFSKPSSQDSNAPSYLATFSQNEGFVKVWQPGSGLFNQLFSDDQHSAQGGRHSLLQSLVSGGHGFKLLTSFKVETTVQLNWEQVVREVRLEWSTEKSFILQTANDCKTVYSL